MKLPALGGAGGDREMGFDKRILGVPCPMQCRAFHEFHFAGTRIVGTRCSRCRLEVASSFWRERRGEIACELA